MKLSLDRSQISQFKRIEFSKKNKIIQGHFPDFLIIGPQRTGTTWLARQISGHSDVYMTFPKEIYFFNRLGKQYSRHHEHLNWGQIMSKPSNGLRELTKVIYFDYLRTGRHTASQLEWYLEFFKNDILQKIVNKSLPHPSSQFENLIKGEATASYATLDKIVIEEIKLLNPNIKAIIMIRDPVSRTWSHAKKDLLRNPGKHLEQVPDKEFYRFFQSPYQISANSYSQNISRWSELIGGDNVFIGFFDQIKHNPDYLLSNILTFLGADLSTWRPSINRHQQVNPTGKQIIPERFRKFLESMYHHEIEYVSHLEQK